MAPNKSSKRSRLRWNQYSRQVLCCLYRFFKRDKKHFEEIFSYIFRKDLNERGIQGFVPFSNLNAQWIWMKHTCNPVWCHVHRDTAFETNAEWSEIIDTIKSTASTLRFHLREKTDDDLCETRDSSQRAENKQPIVLLVRKTNHSPSGSPTSNQSISLQSLCDSHHREDTDLVVNSHGKVCFWCEHELKTEQSEGIQEDQPEDHRTQNQIHGDNHCHGLRQESPSAAHSQLWEGFPRRSPRPYHTEGSVIVHMIAPGVCSQSILQHHYKHNDQDVDQDGDQDDDQDGDQTDNQQSNPGLEGVPTEQLPPLLYRWYDTNSQGANSEEEFLAGMFCHYDFFDPGDISDGHFLGHFRVHVTKRKRPTPFISTFRSPLAPLHRAIHSPRDGKVAIIETSKLDTRVFYANPLAKYTNTFTMGWKGHGEFLIWGRVSKKAIVFTFSANQMSRIAHAHKDINRLLQLHIIRKSLWCRLQLRLRLKAGRKSPYQSGRTLGKLLSLLGFPRIHWENFARRFAASWGWDCTKEFVQFISGLRSELPYMEQELSDSENEGYLASPLITPERPLRRRDPHSPSPSDLEYEPPASDGNTDWCSEDQAPASLGTQSISMEDRSDTIDDDQFSTHETLSSFGLQDNVRHDDCEQQQDDLP